jgi:hypothetical protein
MTLSFPEHHPPSPILFPFTPQFQAGTVLPLSLVLLKKSDNPNKEDKVFLLVEIAGPTWIEVRVTLNQNYS